MTTLGLIVMVVGFLGVLVFAKLRMQPMAVVSTAAMLTGLVIYAWNSTGSGAAINASNVLQMSIGDKVGTVLKQAHGGKRVIWVVDKFSKDSDATRLRMEAFTEAYGVAPEVKVPDFEGDAAAMLSAFKAEHLNPIFEGLDSNTIVVLDIMLPSDVTKAKFLKAQRGKGPIIAMTLSATSGMFQGRVVASAINKGIVLGIVMNGTQKRDPDFDPSASDLKEAFEKIFVWVTKDNLEKNQSNFGIF